MSPSPVLLRRFIRNNKSNPYVDQIKLLDGNLIYANIKYPDGKESTVVVRDLATCPETVLIPESPKKWNLMGVPLVVPIPEEGTRHNKDVAGDNH